LKYPDIFTRHTALFAENQTLKRELAEANQEIVELREALEVAVEALDKIAPDSIVGYCVRLKLEGKVNFVVKT
jgi:hypothetical protein